MVTVKDNKIIMTRGDSLNFKVTIIINKKLGNNPDSKGIYTPVEGDTIRFAMSRAYKGEKDYELLIYKNIPISTMALILEPKETENIPAGIYNYDIKITHADGREDTFISSTIQLVGECE